MANYNRVIIMGNLTRDPEYKQLTSGQAVCRLGLASNRQFKNRQTGQVVQEVCFVDIDVWGVQAESCQQYLSKGRAVLIEGRLKFDSWQDPDGQKRSRHSIVADRVTFLPSAQDSTSFAETKGAESQKSQEVPAASNGVVSSEKSAEEVPDKTSSATFTATTSAQSSPQPTVQTAQESAPAVSFAVPEQKTTASVSGEVTFTDQKPFEDDLPF